MKTDMLKAEREEDVRRAAALLREGRIVALPTETVYGLAARADSEVALSRLRRLKGRPEEKKFALLAPSLEACAGWGAPGAEARRLAEAFWPGPLTLVVPDGSGGELGLRCPDVAVTRRVISLVGAAIVATSANLSGAAPALNAGEALALFEGRLAAVLDGGPARVGRASTVVRFRDGELEILREGALPAADLLAALARGADG